MRRYPVEGYQNGGASGPGKAGGSAISPAGWLFDICDDPGRCIDDPTFGLSIWFRQLWQAQTLAQMLCCSVRELSSAGATNGHITNSTQQAKHRFSALEHTAAMPCRQTVADAADDRSAGRSQYCLPMQDPGFQTLCAQRFQALRAGPWADAVVNATLAKQQATIQPAATRTLNKCAVRRLNADAQAVRSGAFVSQTCS